MYIEFFKLKEKPFNLVPNPAFLYPSSKHRMALTYLEYGLSESIGFILLTGEIGIGKTTLIRRLLSNTDSSMETAVLSNTNLSPDDLVKQVMLEFELEPVPHDKPANLEKLNSFLIDRYSRGGRSLLIIDEAQNLSLSALEEVRMLSNLQTSEDNLLQIMLVGQPELRARIRDPRLAQLAQRIAVSYHLSPLGRQETIEYILYRLKMAGREDDRLFTSDAMDLIFEKSKGVPRSINILCDTALVYAFGDGTEIVDRSLVEHVIADREQEGVVPEGAVWVETRELPEPREIPEEGVSKRLSHLEKMVRQLWSVVNQQGREIQDRLGEDKDRLVNSLQDLFQEERAKSDRLHIKYLSSLEKIKSLKKSLSGKNGHSFEANPSQVEKLISSIKSENDEKPKVKPLPEEEKNRKGILRRFFG